MDEKNDDNERGRRIIDVPASAFPCPNAARPMAMPTGVVMAKVKASVGLNALRIHLARKKYPDKYATENG